MGINVKKVGLRKGICQGSFFRFLALALLISFLFVGVFAGYAEGQTATDDGFPLRNLLTLYAMDFIITGSITAIIIVIGCLIVKSRKNGRERERTQAYTEYWQQRQAQEEQAYQSQGQQDYYYTNGGQQTWQEEADYPEDNPFEILGVPETASQDEIKAAYRKMCGSWHPDKFTPEQRANPEFSKWVNNNMGKINKAYEDIKERNGWH
jgi:hypothetical protein